MGRLTLLCAVVLAGCAASPTGADSESLEAVGSGVSVVERGPQGPRGLRGPVGAPGEQGPRGERGPEGAAGPVGPEGARGPRGVEGAQGYEGRPGGVGPMGPQGVKGEPGGVEPLQRGHGGLNAAATAHETVSLTPGAVYLVTVSLIGAFTDERATFMVTAPATTDFPLSIAPLSRLHRQHGSVELTAGAAGTLDVKLQFTAGSYGANWAYTSLRVH
jgi:Collagen triple helix repeat (20 copies)